MKPDFAMNTIELNRRRFLHTCALSAAAFSAAPFVRAADPARQYKTALIGTGWWGKNILTEALASGRCKGISLCDVDANTLEVAADQVSDLAGAQPKTYRDYRELLEKEKPDLVIIATPDHWHALQVIAAVRAGAHVFVEKPTGHNIQESQAMLKAAQASGCVVQVGLHRRVPAFVSRRNRSSSVRAKRGRRVAREGLRSRLCVRRSIVTGLMPRAAAASFLVNASLIVPAVETSSVFTRHYGSASSAGIHLILRNVGDLPAEVVHLNFLCPTQQVISLGGSWEDQSTFALPTGQSKYLIKSDAIYPNSSFAFPALRFLNKGRTTSTKATLSIDARNSPRINLPIEFYLFPSFTNVPPFVSTNRLAWREFEAKPPSSGEVK